MLTNSKYAYRVESSLEGRHISPQDFVHSIQGVEDAKARHAIELPECTTVVVCLHEHDFELTWPNDPCEYTCKVCGHKEMN